MFAAKEKRGYGLQRDFHVLEREKRVSKILSSHAFRAELEGILQGQLEGSRGPPKISHALSNLQENVAPATAMEAAHRHAAAGVSGTRVILPINDLRGARSSRYVLSERQLRCKLASLCRLVDWFKWSPLVYNHISAQGLTEKEEFLINPYGLLYNEVTASSLVKVNNNGIVLDTGSTQLGVNRSGMELHSTIYRARRDVKCIMHLHTVAGTAVSVMSCGLLPISEEALSVGKVSYCAGRKSLTGQTERKEFIRALGKNKVLILRNHGLVALGSCVEECFYLMYNLIQACKIQVAAASAGLSNLTQIPLVEERPEENVGGAKVWTKRGQMAFEALMRMLDNQGYQTGYRYRGLSLLQSTEADSRPVWDEVVEGGETDTANRQRRRRALKEAARKQRNKEEVWSFLDDNRSRDKPLTKNTRIRVRGGWSGGAGSMSPVAEDSESRDPWEFLTSRDSSVHTAGSKSGTRPSTAQRDTSQQHSSTSRDTSQPHTNTSASSVTTEDNSTSQSRHTTGRKRTRRRRTPHSTTSRSPAHPNPQAAVTANSQNLSAHPNSQAAVTADSQNLSVPADIRPPDLTALQETAERVAHSTSVAVQKLSLKRSKGETSVERTLNSNVTDTLAEDQAHLMSTQPMPLHHHLHSTHLQPDSHHLHSTPDSHPLHSTPDSHNLHSTPDSHHLHSTPDSHPLHSTPDSHHLHPTPDSHPLHSTPDSHHLHSTHLQPDSQGYSSGDEASHVGSPRRPVQVATNTDTRSTLTSPQDIDHHSHLHTTHKPEQPVSADNSTSPTSQPHSSHTPSNTPHRTPFTHSPADISYPNGYSSAEKAAYVARLVADSTGTAVQKLSETMSERNQHLSLSHGPFPPSTDPTDS